MSLTSDTYPPVIASCLTTEQSTSEVARFVYTYTMLRALELVLFVFQFLRVVVSLFLVLEAKTTSLLTYIPPPECVHDGTDLSDERNASAGVYLVGN